MLLPTDAETIPWLWNKRMKFITFKSLLSDKKNKQIEKRNINRINKQFAPLELCFHGLIFFLLTVNPNGINTELHRSKLLIGIVVPIIRAPKERPVNFISNFYRTTMLSNDFLKNT